MTGPRGSLGVGLPRRPTLAARPAAGKWPPDAMNRATGATNRKPLQRDGRDDATVSARSCRHLRGRRIYGDDTGRQEPQKRQERQGRGSPWRACMPSLAANPTKHGMGPVHGWLPARVDARAAPLFLLFLRFLPFRVVAVDVRAAPESVAARRPRRVVAAVALERFAVLRARRAVRRALRGPCGS